MELEFSSNTSFHYNLRKKQLFGIGGYFVLTMFMLLIVYSVITYEHWDSGVALLIKSFFNYIASEIGSGSTLGAFYISLFGGLFFVIIPLEVSYVLLLSTKNNILTILPIFLSGILVSYSLNYFIGMKLATLTKKIITPKKFYKVKGKLNKYGSIAIFLTNVVPFLPSQALAALLGVFKYNRTKFYVFSMLGQLIKYILLSLTIGKFLI